MPPTMASSMAPASTDSLSLEPPRSLKRKKSVFALFKEEDRAFTEDEAASAIKVQRAIRVRWSIYRDYGPDLFFDLKGRSRQSGTIAFDTSHAQWIKVAGITSAMRLNSFITHHWRLPKPESIISVIGSAHDFTLQPALRNAFEKGLAAAAKQAKPWIFTTGCDTGVCVPPLLSLASADAMPASPPSCLDECSLSTLTRTTAEPPQDEARGRGDGP